MKQINILITGVGAPGTWGTLTSLQGASNYDITLNFIGTDIQKDPIGKYWSHKFYQLPSPDDKTYINKLKKILIDEQIHILLPQTTNELFTISKYKNDLEKTGTLVLCSDHKAITNSNNKLNLLEINSSLDLPTPTFLKFSSLNEFDSLLSQFNYPKNNVVIKPAVSNGMRGVRILSENIDEFDIYLNQKPTHLYTTANYMKHILKSTDQFPPLVLMEYLPGQEYTVDAYRDKRTIIAIPRKRIHVRSGISFETEIDTRTDIINISNRLANELDLNHCFGFQFKLNKNKEPMLLECNPRIQGTMVASAIAGCNIILKTVLNALNINHDSINTDSLCNGAIYKRYWGGIGINKGKVVNETINLP